MPYRSKTIDDFVLELLIAAPHETMSLADVLQLAQDADFCQAWYGEKELRECLVAGGFRVSESDQVSV